MIPHSKINIDEKEIKAVTNALKKGFLAYGPIAKAFEEEFSRFIGIEYSCAVNSGTSALHLALITLNIQPDDEIILPSYVCASVLNTVLYMKAKPIIVDINWNDFNINFPAVINKITKKTKAIIIPHMFGQSAEMKYLLRLSIPIIEDCAMSVGATYNRKKVGTFGKINIFSFYATKMIASAEGGIVVTNNPYFYDLIDDIKDTNKKEINRVRYNYKMTDLGAAIGREQLKKLNKFIIERQKIARIYNKELKGLKIDLPLIGKNKTHVYFRYVIKIKNRANEIIVKLNSLGIDARTPVFKPLHRYLDLKDSDYPITTDVFNSAISLPIYPGLKKEEIKYIVKQLKNILKK